MILDSGFLVVDKPPGVTSHDVVAIVRATTGIKKVGHTGTLDPFATGVLPLALGSSTRLIQHLDENEKVYDAQILLGAATDTGDPTGKVIAEAPVPALTRAQVEAVLATFVGMRMQTPPRYSAVKVAGRPLYDYARKGQDVEVKARPVRIDAMELVSLDAPRLRVIIRCSRGTYARVLAEEIGVALGTFGHLDELRRLGSGRFRIEDAVSFSRIAEIVAGDADWNRVLRPARGEARVPWRSRDAVFEGLAPHVIGARDALSHLPSVVLSPIDARRYLQTGIAPPPPHPGLSAWVLLSGSDVIGVGTPPRPPAARGDPPRVAPASSGGPHEDVGGDNVSADAPMAEPRPSGDSPRRPMGDPSRREVRRTGEGGGPAIVRRRGPGSSDR